MGIFLDLETRKSYRETNSSVLFIVLTKSFTVQIHLVPKAYHGKAIHKMGRDKGSLKQL
jgi:hypothetical protein